MKYALDTNVCIRYMNVGSPILIARLQAVEASEIVIPAIVRAELYYGALRHVHTSTVLAVRRTFLEPYKSLDFDDNAAEHYARIRYDLEKRGLVIGPNDLLIASIALANDLTLITHNTGEFARIPNLQIEDWEV